MHPQTTGQATGQVGEELRRIPAVLRKEMSWQEIQAALALRERENFEARYLQPALASDLIERTIPENPTAACKNTASSPKAALGSPNINPEYSCPRLRQVLP